MPVANSASRVTIHFQESFIEVSDYISHTCAQQCLICYPAKLNPREISRRRDFAQRLFLSRYIINITMQANPHLQDNKRPTLRLNSATFSSRPRTTRSCFISASRARRNSSVARSLPSACDRLPVVLVLLVILSWEVSISFTPTLISSTDGAGEVWPRVILL